MPVRMRVRPVPCAVAAMLAAVVTSCASTPEPTATVATERVSAEAAGGQPVVLQRGPIGTIVHDLGQETNLGVVLMNGLEFYQAGPYSLATLTPENAVARLAADTGLKIDTRDSYRFIYPEGFEPLLAFTPSEALDRRVARIPASVRLGADTPLYSALALLGHSLGVTLIADNIVAAAACGETSLRDATLGDALDAILRSARLSASTCIVAADGDAVFLSSPSAVQRDDILANPASLPRPAWLNRRVTLYLPAPPADPRQLSEASGAVTLGACLDTLSAQLGVKVEADTRCARLPVNPSVMNNVTIETALRLIVHQWPLPHYGYVADDERLRFVYLGLPAD